MADVTLLSTASGSMDDYPLVIQVAGGDTPIQYTGSDFRGLIDVLAPIEGVSPTDLFESFKVTSRAIGGANFSIDIMKGSAVIQGDAAVGQGKYIVRSSATVNLVPPAAPGSGATRIHRVVAEVLDKSVSGSVYGWRFRIIEDIGTGLPAEPGSAITLAYVSVAIGQSTIAFANITDKRANSGFKPIFRGARSAGTTYAASVDAALVSFVQFGDNIYTQGSAGAWVRKIPFSGIYRLKASAGWGSVTGSHSCQVYIQSCNSAGAGTVVTLARAYFPNNTGLDVTVMCDTIAELAANTYVKAVSQQVLTGGTGTGLLASDASQNFFEIQYLGQMTA